jgi:TfoX/Sxy family transcriptional regulator of competence genes
MTPEAVVEFLRDALTGAGTIRETRMFGGIGFMLDGNMVAGTFRRGLLARVGKDRLGTALSQKGARQMEMNGRLMEGYVYIAPEELTEKIVAASLDLAVSFVKTLPPKAAKAESKQTKGKRK